MSTVVAIDGPAGAGKSTVAKLLADKLGITYVNTGSLYRAVAWALDQQNLAVEELTADFLEKLSLEYVNGSLLVNGNDPGAALRTAEIAAGASKVSKLQIVRDHLLPVQREAARIRTRLKPVKLQGFNAAGGVERRKNIRRADRMRNRSRANRHQRQTQKTANVSGQ